MSQLEWTPDLLFKKPKYRNMAAVTLVDTTLRSVVFGSNKFDMTPYTGKQVTTVSPVGQDKFDKYYSMLGDMAKLSRLIYCDTGIIREALVLSSGFASDANNLITALDKKYAAQRKEPSAEPDSKEGRPMKSYILADTKARDNGMKARYIATPSDVTFMFLNSPGLSGTLDRQGDVLLVFKGSSTARNFKHDIQAVAGADIGTAFPALAELGPGVTSLRVPSGFIKHLGRAFHHIQDGIRDYKPKRLFITGHSLGGAYATICAFVLGLLRPAGIESIHLVTFGAPTTLSDAARNKFNDILESGYMTLDRVVSKSSITGLDWVTGVPTGFSHPGYQPLMTEMYPEKKGRPYHLDTVKRVFTGVQVGGLFGFGKEKGKYDRETVSHMPNRLVVHATKSAGTFAHAEYLGMTFLNAFRTVGLKNPGFKTNTFIANLTNEGITFIYVASEPGDTVASDADSDETMGDQGKGPAPSAPLIEDPNGDPAPPNGDPTTLSVNQANNPSGGRRRRRTIARRERSARGKKQTRRARR